MFSSQEIKRIKRAIKRLFTDREYILINLRPVILYKLQLFSFLKYQGKSNRLNTLSLFLTWRCNLRCSMCNLWGEEGIFNKGQGARAKRQEAASQSQELTIEEWKSIIDDVAKYKPLIVLTGGEPLLYKQWYELTKYIKTKNITILLLTNGILLRNYKNELIETIDMLNISIDGVKEINDKIRGNGVFDEIIEGIREINNIKHKKKLNKPYLNIAYTISEMNYLYLEEFIQFLQKEKLDINMLLFQHLEFTSKENIEKTAQIFKEKFNQQINIWYGFDYIPTNLDAEKLAHQIERIKNKNYDDIYISFFPNFNSDELIRYYKYYDQFPQKRVKACLGPYLDPLITPEGDLWICPDYKIGNLKEEKFACLWNNDKAKEFRLLLLKENFVLPVCRLCGCFYNR